MDLEIFISVASLIASAVGWLLFYPYKRKAEELKNNGTSAEQWRELYNESRQDNRELNAKIDALYAEIREHRGEKAALRSENEELKVKAVRLELLKCEVPGCRDRKPKSDY